MTIKDVTYFAAINHTKVNKFQERVYNVSLYNWLIFDLIEVDNQLMQLTGVDNQRVPFTFWPIN